jgi:urea transport system permease protein
MLTNLKRVLALVCLLLVAAPALAQDFAAAVQALDTRSFPAKRKAVEAIAASGHERAVPVLRAFLEGDLYSRDGQVIIVPDAGVPVEAVSGRQVAVDPSELSRIIVNNPLRIQLRGLIAGLSLNHPNEEVRLAAVQQMIGSMSPEDAALLREALPDEESAVVRDAMESGIALAELRSQDPAERLAAVEALAGRLQPAVRVRLSELAEQDPVPAVREAAQQALAAIEGKLGFYRFIENVFFGLSLGSVLVLAAIGLAITFGVMGVINMAHGELIMLGAYTTYVIQLLMPQHLGLSILVAIPAAFLVSGLVGVAIERGVIRFLYGRPLETLLATFGISLLLQQLVRSIFSPLNRSVATPEWLAGSWIINPALSITYNRLAIVIFSLMVFAALLLVLKRTSLGLKVRAVTQNRAMARAVGVRSARIDALTFGLGSGIAGIAGVALSQLTNVGPNLGQAYIVDSFLVVVFGGVGNLWGTLVAGLSLGVLNKFMEPYAGAVLAKILVLIFIILFIQKRPRGLFPQKGRFAEA